MEYILNELSLSGTFPDVDTFAERGLKPMTDILKELRKLGFSVILKKSSFYSSRVCPNVAIMDLNTSKTSLFSDRWRAMRSLLASMQTEPFWDVSPKQDLTKIYLMANDVDEIDVSQSSVSEAMERAALVLSFQSDSFKETTLFVRRVDETHHNKVDNVSDLSQLYNLLFYKGKLGISDYFKKRFIGGKLCFEELDTRNGFNLIDKDNISLFLSAFTDFECMSWQQIRTSDGFDYKTFNKNRQTKPYFSDGYWEKGIKKFRVNQKIRCFGYEQEGIFHILRFDLDHILSDKG